MKTWGIILTLLGAVLGIIGYSDMGSLEYALRGAFGAQDPLPAVMFYGGVGCFVVGIIVLICAVAKSGEDK